MRNKWPKKGELVVVKIKRIMDYGTIAELLEYEGKEGFIHISNVTKSWVKNIRSHVSKGETRVAEVLQVDKDKNSINLSLKDVTDTQIRRKMNLWKRTKRAERVIGKLAEDMGKEPEKEKDKIMPELIKAYGDPFSCFEEAATYGKESLDKLKAPKKWKEKIFEFSEENITPKEVTIEGEFHVEVETGNGVETIKKAMKPLVEGDNVKIEYVSAPRYKVEIKATDYKEAEEKLDKATEKLKKVIEKENGTVTLKRKGK